MLVSLHLKDWELVSVPLQVLNLSSVSYSAESFHEYSPAKFLHPALYRDSVADQTSFLQNVYLMCAL